jgi:tRNA-dihydrouridine synthase 3
MAGESDETMAGEFDVATTSNIPSGNNESTVNGEQSTDKKRTRTGSQDVEMADSPVKRQKGVAPIKAESVTYES